MTTSTSLREQHRVRSVSIPATNVDEQNEVSGSFSGFFWKRMDELVAQNRICPLLSQPCVALTSLQCTTQVSAAALQLEMDQDSIMTAVGRSHCSDQEDGAIEYGNGGAVQDLDAQVARFLETAFVASHDDGGEDSNAAVKSSAQPCKIEPSVLSKNEDALILDFIETFGVPDLEGDSVDDPPSGGCSNETGNERALGVTATKGLQLTSSLYVLIPASALASPPLEASRLQRKPVQKTPSPAVKQASQGRDRVPAPASRGP